MSAKNTHFVVLGYKLPQVEEDTYGFPVFQGQTPEKSEALWDSTYDGIVPGDMGYIASPMDEWKHVLAGRIFAKASVYDAEDMRFADLEGKIGEQAKLEVKAWLQSELGLDIPINKIRLYIGTAWR